MQLRGEEQFDIAAKQVQGQDSRHQGRDGRQNAWVKTSGPGARESEG